MKKSDLFLPFKFENRKPIIINRFLFVPKHYDKHHLFNEEISFENKNEINIEYCSGNGTWIVEKAKLSPKINFIAVEMKFLRARQIWLKMHSQGINNLFVICSDAFTFTKYYLKDSSIADVFINFPDPWPKRKHAKKRLINKEFLGDVNRVMKPNSVITIVTDHTGYLEQMIETFVKIKEYKSIFQKPYFVQDIKNFGSSFFSSLFESKGKAINYLKFSRS